MRRNALRLLTPNVLFDDKSWGMPINIGSPVSAGDQEKIADCLFDFANTGYSLKDWLKECASFSKAAVEDYVKKNPPLDACCDICNANKHYVITKYTPVTDNVSACGNYVDKRSCRD
ncbi:MAG: hypothetical protein Q8Q81_03815 [Oxalobacteraceae bacterium]|nr:hypothetical protein [Oxalobacteraceae bacterium]